MEQVKQDQVEVFARQLIEKRERRTKITKELEQLEIEEKEILRLLNRSMLGLPIKDAGGLVRESILKFNIAKNADKAAAARVSWRNRTPEQKERWKSAIRAGRLRKQIQKQGFDPDHPENSPKLSLG